MAMSFLTGIPYKKVKNNTGDQHVSRIPMLYKTLASLVFRPSTGNTVDADLTTLEGRKKVEVYQTATAYNQALAAGTATDVLAIVLSDQ